MTALRCAAGHRLSAEPQATASTTAVPAHQGQAQLHIRDVKAQLLLEAGCKPLVGCGKGQKKRHQLLSQKGNNTGMFSEHLGQARCSRLSKAKEDGDRLCGTTK